MLDVHPPHESVHTWKDFFIHIATIVIGLLIAVGLEQLVEGYHHRHQRHQLQEQLIAEAKSNRLYIENDMQVVEAYVNRALAQTAAVARAGPTGPLSLHRLPPGLILFPDTGVWLAAKDNGSVALLPATEQVFDTDLYRTESRAFATSTGAWDLLLAALSALDSSLVNAPFQDTSDAVDFSAQSPAQRAQYAARLAQVAQAARDLERELVYFQFYNDRELKTIATFDDGPEKVADVIRLRQQRAAEHPHSQFTFHAR